MEIWKPVPGYEGCYEVSSLGRVKSLARTVGNRWQTQKPVPEQIKAFSSNKQGYLSAHLYRGRRMKKFYVHRLVAEVFLANDLRLPQVNHLNGDVSDNRVENLQWCSSRENCQHAVDAKLYESAKGEQIASSKLKESDVLEIRRMVASGALQRDVAPIFGLSRTAVSKIVLRQRWAHVA